MDIVLKDVTVRYGEKTVLDRLSLSFPAGRVTSVMAPSGWGKTTLLYILAGLKQPDEGSMEGVPGKIAFLFQEDRLCEDFSVLSNVRMVAGKNMADEEIKGHLKELGLEENAAQKVRTLSGGMKRRTALARAICYRPELLLLDEPFKGLDEKLKRSTADYILKHTQGKTVICVTHDRTEAGYMGGNVLILPDHRIENA